MRQLELTYGGGKTHTLITLYHLFREPDALPDRPAVREFRAGGALPRAVPVSLCFDKIDVERGIDGVRGPNGGTRTLRHPWSVLAFQLAGADGLRAIHGEGEAEERETPPAEPLLVALLERPQARGFFQYLAQAAAKVDRAAMVASLLATDPKKQRDETGQRLQAELFDVFRRQREEGVQPSARRTWRKCCAGGSSSTTVCRTRTRSAPTSLPWCNESPRSTRRGRHLRSGTRVGRRGHLGDDRRAQDRLGNAARRRVA